MDNTEKLISWFKTRLVIIATAVIIIGLFVIILTELNYRIWSTDFLLEFAIVALLALQTRSFWYHEGESAERRNLASKREDYYDYVEKYVTNVDDFENFLILLNEKNRKDYIANKLANRKPEDIPKKYIKILKKADKLKQVKAVDVLTMSKQKKLYDSSNNYAKNKAIYLVMSSIIQCLGILTLSLLVFENFVGSWGAVARFLGYMITIVLSAITGYIAARNILERDTIDHIDRCQFIIDKYRGDKNAI